MSYQTVLANECLITHFTSIRVLISMYIVGIAAFGVVCMKLIIQCSLVKTQRLNIRIHSHRKTIISIAMFT
jgi:hypothetical protein